jgi:hypothetical protein
VLFGYNERRSTKWTNSRNFLFCNLKPRPHPHTMSADSPRTLQADSLCGLSRLCTRTRDRVQSLGMSADCPRTVRGQIICMRTVFVFSRLGWKTTDKVCRSGCVRVQPAHTYFLQCVSLLAEFELLTCG